MKKDGQINQILLIFLIFYFHVNYRPPLGPELRAASFGRGKQNQQVSGHCGSLSQKSFICKSCSNMFTILGEVFHRVSALWTSWKTTRPFESVFILKSYYQNWSLHQVSIVRTLRAHFVCLPSLTKDQMQWNCNSNNTGMLEEIEHISCEEKIILLSIPSEWS